MKPWLASLLSDLSGCWGRLVVTDLVCKTLAFVLLTPLLGLLVRVLLATAGDAVLVDQDILYFLLGPVGWVCAVLAGGVWLAIVALEQAALLGILAAERRRGTLGVPDALRFAARHAPPVIRVTVRMVAWTLLTAAPFLALIGLVYFVMLADHDINFYLREKPPKFLAACGLAGLAVATLVGVLLRLLTGWFLALPAVLFEGVAPARALSTSRARVEGHRARVLAGVVVWLVGTGLLSALASGLVVAVGRLVVPMAATSLTWLLPVVGALILLGSGLGLVVNLLSTVLFAWMLLAAYEHAGGEARLEASPRHTTGRGTAWFRLTLGRLVALSLAAAVLAGLLGATLARTVWIEDDVVVIAHRGASLRAPENTLASIRAAIDEGADWVEIDVQETADGEVAVFHDSDFMRLAGNPLKIWDATAADLETIDVGGSFSPEHRGERAPLLGEVLDLCGGEAKLLIELKYYGHDERLEERVLDLVSDRGLESRVAYMSLKLPAIEKLKALQPEATAGALLSVAAGNRDRLAADFWALNARFVTRRIVQKAHQNGRRVYVWTVDDPLTMSRMIGRGVDGLITNDPALARSVIRQRSQLSAVERLLLETTELFGLDSQTGDQ